jgi:hypothetical protein
MRDHVAQDLDVPLDVFSRHRHLRQVPLPDALESGRGQLHHLPRQPQLHRVHRSLAPFAVGQGAGSCSPVDCHEPRDLSLPAPQQLLLTQHPPLLSQVPIEPVFRCQTESLNYSRASPRA